MIFDIFLFSYDKCLFHINFSHNNEPPSELSYKVIDASLAISENKL